MFSTSFRKVPDKINNGMINIRSSLAIPTGKNVYRKAKLATICLLAIFVFCGVFATIGSSKNFAHASSVNGLGVGIYWDQACTNRTLSLNWGHVDAGSNNALTIYIRNEMSSAASLMLETTNFIPSGSSNYLALNWNYSGQVLSADEVIPLELTLTVLPDIVGVTNFSFDTIITASER